MLVKFSGRAEIYRKLIVLRSGFFESETKNYPVAVVIFAHRDELIIHSSALIKQFRNYKIKRS